MAFGGANLFPLDSEIGARYGPGNLFQRRPLGWRTHASAGRVADAVASLAVENDIPALRTHRARVGNGVVPVVPQ